MTWSRTVRWIGVASLAVAGLARAQDASVAEDRAAMFPEGRGGGVVSGVIGAADAFAPASPSDADIGEQVLLQPADSYEAFSAWTNWNYYWTSNAELLDDAQGADGFLTGTVGASFLPYFGANLFGEFSAEQSLFRYAKNTSLDFNSLSLTAGLIYVIRELGDLTVFGNYNYDLLTASDLESEIFHSHTLTAGVRKVFNLSRAHLLYTSVYADFVLAGQPAYALRNDYVWLSGYQVNLTRALRFDLYYQLSAQAYVDVDRADLNQLVGGGLSLAVTRWLSVQALTSLGINSSTDEYYSYFAANLGGGIGILVNF